MYPYLIVSPGLLNHHAGTRALKRLCDKLKEKGAQAYMSYERSDLKDYIQNENAIVVYPEIWKGLLVEAKRTVCWVLNPQGVNHQEKVKFYWDNYTGDIPKDRLLYLDIIERDLFNNDRCEFRRWSALYVGKGQANTEPQGIGEINEITPDYPADRAGVAELLKKSYYLYTYDALTSLAAEACLCGTPVVFLENEKHSKELFIKHSISPNGMAAENIQEAKDKAMKSCHLYKRDYYEHFGKEDLLIKNFIEVTQNL